ncbi:protein Lines homolog 1 [Puntigrus tetrazona]|uniref:protein Lines homolog 1 n=1 Tax=Puntigrus tetrazona TaxID=1606681 RepID=UPI001C8A29E4|nr:protein Lines homolog 1 [Puntigrus tetrazona]XP_043100020.1 protein Lines homolog 1 [Puntigrus tetrazona]XP_043100021.1 protein Lines homolog 1 [Puntigrus tetrazona]
MDASGLDLRDTFGLLRAGSAPSVSSEELAGRISSCFASQTEKADAAWLCLTLTESIVRRLTARSLPQDAAAYYEDVTRRLFGENNLMAHLVSLLRSPDKLTSHLSAKCVSACVILEIRQGGSSCVWRRTCARVFEESVSGGELDSCLWSLTAVIKAVLRGDTGPNQRDVLTELLSGLDSSVSCLRTALLTPDERERPGRSKTWCEFLDLAEALIAARLRFDVRSPVQRVVFVESRALPRVVGADVEHLVKKRALLLLKRSLLRRAGEDWASAEVRRSSDEDLGLAEDALAAAAGVLEEVAAGWLKEVPVKAQGSFFGGDCDASRTDDAVLRAVSLVLLKSLEIRVQAQPRRGSLKDVDVCWYLSALMSFLRRHGTPASPDAHGCSWVSVVFAEQDDDMMESAKALIGLYLYQKSLSCSDPGVCVRGGNPHCHFILLLRSLCFDHSVLLDFLISSETCFLEYCVRYLKLLLEDPAGFSGACRRIGGRSDPSVPCARSAAGSRVPRLVDYGSSDESEDERVSDGGSGERDCGRELEQAQAEHASDWLLGKVFACLLELKTAVSRLHDRGLFPYNPASLLKLLNNIEPLRNTLC